MIEHHPHEPRALCLISLHQGEMRQRAAERRQQVGGRSWHKTSTSSPLCAQSIHAQLTSEPGIDTSLFQAKLYLGTVKFSSH